MTGIMIYSSLIWNNIWSHSHDLAKVLGAKHKVYWLEVPENKAKGHEHLARKSAYQVPKNVELITPKRPFSKFSIAYLLYTQFFTIKSFLKHRRNIDVLMIYNTYDILLLWLARLMGKKVIFMYVDEYEELTPNRLARWFISKTVKSFLKHSHHVVCTARILEEKAKKLNRNVTYLPNAVKLSEFPKSEAKKRKGFTVGFVGSLGNWVDADMIADAAKSLASDHEIRFCIVGPGPGHDLLQRRIRIEGIKNIELMGYVPHDEAIQQMYSFDIAIIPFKINKVTDSVSPVKLFEYWLAGNPVISTRTYELSQFSSQLLFIKDANEMAEQVRRLKHDTKLADRLAAEGKKLVVERFNWEKEGKIYIDLIKRLVS